MKQMILVFVVGVVMFGASAAASWYLHKAEKAQSADAGDDKHNLGGKIQFASGGSKGAVNVSGKTPAALDPQAPPAPRNTTPSAEQVAQLAASLRQQQETIRNREQNLVVRLKHLEVIHQDLRNERKTLEDLRVQVNEEMKALTEKLDGLERKSSDLDKKKQEIGKKEQDVKQTIIEVETAQQKNLKKMAVTFDSMDADTAGELLQQMADGGKMEMAVNILSLMQERQAARVLGQMTDRGTAVQILDKMKGVKRPVATP